MAKPILTSLRGKRLGISKEGHLVNPDGGFSPESGTATATAGAATLARVSGKITTEALSTAAGATYTLTITNTDIEASDIVFASIANGTGTAGTPAITRVTAAANSLVIIVQNIHSANAFNGTMVISFYALKV